MSDNNGFVDFKNDYVFGSEYHLYICVCVFDCVSVYLFVYV